MNKHVSMISALFSEVHLDDNCVLLGYYAAGIDNILQTFRDNLSASSSRLKMVVPKRRKEITTPRCAVTHKSAVIEYKRSL
jgi:hypothetical protein